MNSTHTIAAVSSSLAPCCRIVLRLSGPHSHQIAGNLSEQKEFSPASAQQTMISFNGFVTPASIYAFRAPRSYTGEDAIEFHIPGSPVLATLLLDELYRQGARAAEPGEFTARAFFNGKIGLTQAEGVAAAIAAGNENELHAARQLLAGELSRRLMPITESLAQTLALIEVGIDFTEEEVTFLASDEIAGRLQDADESLANLLEQSGRFEQLSHEPKIVFAGRPNAGKSSLINALTGQNRAVVSNVSGTTRDVLTATLYLARGPVQLTDIAGIDSAGETTIDLQMQERAARAIESADHVILIHDATDLNPPLEVSREPELTVLTKADLQPQATLENPALRVSAKTGEGFELLRKALDQLAFGTSAASPTLTINRRHLQAINIAREALSCSNARVAENAPELVAMDLREVLDALGSITGQITPDDILGRVFSAFCIGK